MSRHEFIFSDLRHHRIKRHVIFWLAWWLAYLLLFQIPILELKGWGLSREAAPNTFKFVEQIGVSLYILKILIFNSLLTVVVPQMILTYVVLYWLLPNYFYRKKNPLIVASVIVLVLVGHVIVATQFRWFGAMGNYLFGLTQKLTTFYDFTMSVGRNAVRQELSSLPFIIGMAVLIKLSKRWWLKQQETEQVAREKTKAELRLLKAQVHPHFLFNTLNNIYFFTLSASPKAPEMITKLSGLLHYILNECNQPLVSLEKEVRMIQDYISLEKIRYGDDMNISIELPANCSNKMIAPLLLIPFVENSFKHGASKMLNHPFVMLRISIENNTLHFFIRNGRPEMKDKLRTTGNIGLKNVKQRLQLLYPYEHALNIIEEPETFSVLLQITLSDTILSSEKDEATKPENQYAVA